MKYLSCIILSSVLATTTFAATPGIDGEVIPFGDPKCKPYMADYDGDGMLDAAVYDPSTGYWYIQNSSIGYQEIWWGVPGVIPVPADYDGDGKTDIAVYHKKTLCWYINASEYGITTVKWGYPGCIPTPDDYDNDGKADMGFYLPMNGHWYLMKNRKHPINESLLAYYTFDGNALDSSGDNNHGTVHGASLTSDRYGKACSAYAFDGINDYIETEKIFSDTESISFSLWAYIPDADGAYRVMLSESDMVSWCDLTYNVYGPAGSGWQTKDNDWLNVSPTELPRNQWFHMVLIADHVNNRKQVWINGVKTHEDNSWHGTANIDYHNKLTLGCFNGSDVMLFFYKGKLDEFRAYDKALTADDIAAIYNTEKP